MKKSSNLRGVGAGLPKLKLAGKGVTSDAGRPIDRRLMKIRKDSIVFHPNPEIIN